MTAPHSSSLVPNVTAKHRLTKTTKVSAMGGNAYVSVSSRKCSAAAAGAATASGSGGNTGCSSFLGLTMTATSSSSATLSASSRDALDDDAQG